MNIGYLLSILDLYLLREHKDKAIIGITNLDKELHFDFSYSKTDPNKTFIKIDKEILNNYLKDIINKIQSNLIVIDESYHETSNKKMYTIIFNSGRTLTLNNFSKKEINNIRNMIFNINREYDITNIKESYDNDLQVTHNESNRFRYSMGFTNYITLFITTIFLLDIFMIALWIFKAFIK